MYNQFSGDLNGQTMDFERVDELKKIEFAVVILERNKKDISRFVCRKVEQDNALKQTQPRHCELNKPSSLSHLCDSRTRDRDIRKLKC